MTIGRQRIWDGAGRGFRPVACRVRTLLLLALLAASSACSNGPNSSYEEIGDRVNTRGFGHKYAQPEGQTDPVLGPGDDVDVQFASQTELNSRQPVAIEGTIQAPFVGPVKVAGLTAGQIRDKLTILITPYIKDVSIQVIAVGLQSKKIYIYTTGQYGELVGREMALRGDYTLIDLVTELGGFRFNEDDHHVKVIRGDPRHPKVLNINVRDMIINGYTAGNIQMQADDMVWLPPTFWAKLAQVINAVTYPIRTLSNATREVASTIFFIERGGRTGRGGSSDQDYYY